MTKKHLISLFLVFCLCLSLTAMLFSACGTDETTTPTSGTGSDHTTPVGSQTRPNPPGTTDPDSPPIVPGKEGSITFRDAEGNVLETVRGAIGSTYAYRPAKEGYGGVSCFTDADMTKPYTVDGRIPDGSITVYVRWDAPIHYTIAFDGGRGVGEMASIPATYGERVTLPENTFTRKNEVFAEWRLYRADGSYTSFVDGARVRDLTVKDGATVTLVAAFDTADAANFTVENGVVTAYTGRSTIVSFPQSGRTIAADVFKNSPVADRITKITVPDGYAEIAKGAFAPCTALTELTLPFIGGSATENPFLAYLFGADTYTANTYSFTATYDSFYGLQPDAPDLSHQAVPATLKKVTITGELRTVAEGAFYMIYGLQKVLIPNCDRLYAIGKSAFDGCWQLGYDADFGVQNPLYFLENVETIGERAFAAYISEENEAGESYIFSRLFEIPSLAKVETIGNQAFYYCIYLMNASFGSSLTTIGESAFENCATLTELTLPDSLTDIGAYAFMGCASLTEVTLGSSVRSLGSFAFAGCTALGAVYLTGDAPARTALIPFSNGLEYKYNAAGALEGYDPVYTYLTLYVSSQSALNAYRSAWTGYASLLSLPTAADEAEIYYYNEREDGSFSAMLTLTGGTLTVYDPYGDLLSLIDPLDVSGLGSEYTLLFREAADVSTVGGEKFWILSSPAILGYLGEEYTTTVRVRERTYRGQEGSFSIREAEVMPEYPTTLGDGADSLYKIEEDGIRPCGALPPLFSFGGLDGGQRAARYGLYRAVSLCHPAL